jgi:hypothetical protein
MVEIVGVLLYRLGHRFFRVNSNLPPTTTTIEVGVHLMKPNNIF